MKVFIVLTALVAVACAAKIPDHEIQAEFETFKATHGKSYANEAEELYRSKIFKENLIRINKHNERFDKGEVTFTVGVNQFADMHTHEMVEARNGYRTNMKKPSARVHRAPLTWPWSTQVDWRQHGLVSGVKDQGQCGSCWSFSATGAIEGQMAKKTGKIVPLSEQNLVDCTTEAPYEMAGCNGGLMDAAFQYVADNQGIDTEEYYPYTALDGVCKFNASFVGGTDSSYVDVCSSEKDLQHAVQTVGPVSVAIDASLWSFNMYKGGVYHDTSCGNTAQDLDHGVLVVGFGSNKMWGSNDYWIVKNSWGASWGEEGYIRMARNQNNACGIALEASYPVV